MAISDIQALIERSTMEQIRLTLVEEGYLPDITLFPNTDLGLADYKTACETIRQTKGFFIDLLANSPSQALGFKRVPRIVIKSRRFVPGGIGNVPNPILRSSGGGFKKYRVPPRTSDLALDIHLCSKTTEQERVLNAILAMALEARKYIPLYNDDTQRFLLLQTLYRDFEDLDEGIVEKIYTYEAKDLWQTAEVEIGTVAKITEITVENRLGVDPDTPKAQLPPADDTFVVD